MPPNESLKRLQPLLKQPVFTAKEAKEHGVSARMLAYYCQIGLIDRMGRGIYRSAASAGEQESELVAAVRSVPDGVVCLLSALAVWGLTDYVEREYWIAVPNEKWAPKRHQVRIVRMRNVELGRTTHKISGETIPLFNAERSIIDAFRYLDLETAQKALKAYLKGSGGRTPQLHALREMAQRLRVDIAPYLVALLA